MGLMSLGYSVTWGSDVAREREDIARSKRTQELLHMLNEADAKIKIMCLNAYSAKTD